jgi:hypothetical protein
MLGEMLSPVSHPRSRPGTPISYTPISRPPDGVAKVDSVVQESFSNRDEVPSSNTYMDKFVAWLDYFFLPETSLNATTPHPTVLLFRWGKAIIQTAYATACLVYVYFQKQLMVAVETKLMRNLGSSLLALQEAKNHYPQIPKGKSLKEVLKSRKALEASHLYPSLWKEKITYSNGLYEILYLIFNRGLGSHDRTAEVSRIFEKIDSDYRKLIVELKEHLRVYKEFLDSQHDRLQPAPNQRKIKNAVNFILNFYNNIQRFVDWECLKFDSELIAFIEQLEAFYFIIDMEAVIGKRVPYHLLFNISLGVSLDEKEEIQVKKFLQECTHSNVTTNQLQRGLRAYLSYCKENHLTSSNVQKGQVPNLVALKNYMQSCVQSPLFNQASEEYLEQRKLLREGSTIRFVKKNVEGERVEQEVHELVLGPRADTIKPLDRFIFFQITSYTITRTSYNRTNCTLNEYLGVSPGDAEQQDVDQMLCTVGYNEAILEMKAACRSEFCKQATFHFVDERGQFALVEKLYEGDQYPEKHKELLFKLLSSCIETNEMPDPFRPEYFMLGGDASGEFVLKSAKPLASVPLRWDEFEKFLYLFSKGDVKTYHQIYDKLGLELQPGLPLIRSVVLSSLDERPLDLTKNFNRIDKGSELNALAKKLQSEMKNKHAKICESLTTSCPEFKEEDKKRVGEILIEHYKITGAVAFLWPNLEELTISTFKGEDV